ncbi:DNA-binding protein [Oryzomonas rubra]|uniref:DNA-binding protein n=1 Tax=Oryzomonas rubra TaxID=2509454 RepID=A0A5A9XS81_9BACT|nr:DNA-binding protein [Oryzomonas rubra]KAA0895405.1 DNA-binding protein [Oryzomonas rubra]
MTKDRFFSIATLAIVLNSLLIGSAFAGFGFGSDVVGKSGLDFAKGYDVNTVTTVTGRVASSPQTGEKEHIFVDVRAGGEIISLNLGPKSFWEKKEIPLHPNDDISAKGSKAQGKDGKTYLMVQKLTNKTTGSQAALRNDQGRAAWSGWNAGGMMQGGGMMRSGGGMMRR